MKLNWQNVKNVISGNTAYDRRWRKRLYGVEELPKLPLRGRIFQGIFTFIFLGMFGFLVFNFGFFMGTGTLPIGPGTESIVPPEIQPTVTAEQAETSIANSPLDLVPYGDRNNCVEMAFVAARQLWWDGYQSTVVRIDFGDGSGHMVVGVPTVDAGWKFLDPQGNLWINPVVGGFFMNKQIVGMYYLYDFVWEPIEVMDK